jgi:hypothetical protein
MSPWMIVLTIVGVAFVLPLVASYLMAVALESVIHEGIYDDLDS